MKISYGKLKCYNCKDKHTLIIDGEVVAGADSKKRVAIMAGFIQGVYSEEDICDKKIVRVLNPYREQYLKQAA